jgi:hypothetical protein
MKEIGEMIYKMVMELKHGLMEADSKVIIRRERNMDKVNY